ncbi:MAG: GTPase [Planctomycetota bacterium]
MVVLTPPGAGAIGVVRVVGPDAVSLVNQAFRPASGGGLSAAQGDRLRYGHFVDGDETIDDVIVSVTMLGRHEGTKARRHEEKSHEATRHGGQSPPRSHEETGHLVVDISAHGGVRVIERILQTLERLGALVGEPGDAVGLAWPTGSLIEYEAVEALTRAKTERAVRLLAWQRENLPAALEAVALLCRSDPAEARRRLPALADGYPVARTLMEGVTVALVGPPNSGKSTLFNRLIGRPATVVSPQPGTTRDWVAEAVEMDGVPVTLVDTAGRREADDPLEQQAVEAGRRVVERAEVRLLLLDGSQPLAQPGEKLLAASRLWAGCLTVINKADAGNAWPAPKVGRHKNVSISALTGAGCDKLVSAILEMLGYHGWVESVPCLFTARQAEAAADVLSVLPRDPMAAEQRLERCLIGRCDQVTTTGGGL